MYSDKARKVIGEAKPGDFIRVKKKEKTYEGILMPSPDFSDSNTIVLKLKNGYNIGIMIDSVTAVEKLKSKTEKKKPKRLKFDEKKPAVSLVTTGGTITSKVDYETGGVTSLMSAEELLNLAPELREYVNIIDIITPFNRMSESISFKDYEELAKAVAKELKKAQGVIVTHGTDTLHYTAAALSFALKTPKPVVLTGAQRSSDRPSSDAAMNLLCSAHAAVSDMAEVGIVMHATSNDDYCYFLRGTKVKKMHSSRRDAFRPINALPLAKVFPDGRIEKISEYRKRREDPVEVFPKFENKVALVKFAPNLSPEVIDFYVSKGYKGIVIEATGLGQVALNTHDKEKSWLPSIKNAIDKGIVMCFAPQTNYGRLDPFVYAEARRYYETGVLFLEDMLPETAYVKLAWVLANTKSVEEAKGRMLEDIAGEVSNRMLFETFLY